MTRNRSDALIRDVAKLLVDYPARDWRPVLDELLSGGQIQQRLADAVEALIVHAEDTRAKAKAKAKPKAARLPATRHAKPRPAPENTPPVRIPRDRLDTLSQFTKAFDARQVLTTRAAIADVFLAIGGKSEAPKTRKEAGLQILVTLAEAPEPVYQSVLETIAKQASSSEADDYRLWFDIIRPHASGTGHQSSPTPPKKKTR